MGTDHADIALEIGAPVREFAGEDVHARFMEGVEAVAEASDDESPIAFADWLRGALERLDRLVDEQTRRRIFETHGFICAEMNRSHIDAALERRRQYASLGECIDAQAALVRDGDVVYQTYTPRSQGGGKRCYCSFWHPLPPEETISLTWCHCGKGFTMKLWEALLGRPVAVELLQSRMAGADTCKFAIHLPEGWNAVDKEA